MTEMTLLQQITTIALCILGTMLTRFLPFMIFSSKKPTPAFIQYLGKALPSAIFGMLVIYCLKNVNIVENPHGIPELFSIALTVLIHLWKRQMLFSIAAGTLCYMALIQLVF